ncbi:hypothetical protein [Pseudonocardia sp. NPDC049635]|uniref:hypothetical protein n=1 Tax=Pseudonocardia sp. NPDC049635 TaxID=3155506 RepID=UPI0033DF2F6A
MPASDRGAESARRGRLLAVASRKRRSAELRRREAAQFEAEAADLETEAEWIARNLAAEADSATPREGAA